ncbi:MAG: hypothetical protein ABI232_03205 [Jatrophihabitantaceae bacterium]
MISASTCTGECLKSGPWGLAIVLLLCVACYFLFRSMSRHLKRVREEFPSDPPAAATPKTVVADGINPATIKPTTTESSVNEPSVKEFTGGEPTSLTKSATDDVSHPPA